MFKLFNMFKLFICISHVKGVSELIAEVELGSLQENPMKRMKEFFEEAICCRIRRRLTYIKALYQSV